MSFLKKAKRAVRHYMSMKAVRKKIGLSGKSKFIRQLKRGLRSTFGSRGSSQVLSGAPTSASTYQQGRSISQLMGGV